MFKSHSLIVALFLTISLTFPIPTRANQITSIATSSSNDTSGGLGGSTSQLQGSSSSATNDYSSSNSDTANPATTNNPQTGFTAQNLENIKESQKIEVITNKEKPKIEIPIAASSQTEKQGNKSLGWLSSLLFLSVAILVIFLITKSKRKSKKSRK